MGAVAGEDASRLANRRLRIVPAGVRSPRGPVVPGNDRHADDLQTFGFNSVDDFLIAADDLRGAGLPADVVGPHEEDHVGHPRVLKNVTVEPLDPGGAGRRRHEALADDRISADPLVDHRLVLVGLLCRPPETEEQNILPPVVPLGRRATPIRDRIAKSNDGAGCRLREDIDRR